MNQKDLIWDKIKKGVFVIAEIGKNFIQTEEERPQEEYLKNAKALIDAAVESECNAVKFQTHVLEDEQLNINVVSPHFKSADRVSWIARNEKATPFSFWDEIKSYCNEKGIIFFSTPMSRKAAQKLEKVGVSLWKVGSGDVQDYVMLDFMVETGKPIIISTGMVGLSELDELVKFFRSKNVPLIILYCISKYPCPPEYFNLSTIESFVEKYPDAVVGFSDHSIDGHGVDLAAIKLGARVIEKHFSFDRNLWGADHKASITPSEMKAMVSAIRKEEFNKIDPTPFYGEKTKELEGAESMFRPYFNKSLMAGADIPKGAVIEKEMIFAMRPKMYAGGLPSNKFYEVVGKKATKNLKKFDPITNETIS